MIIIGYAVLRIEKIKTLTDVENRLKHNRREIPCKSVVKDMPEADIKIKQIEENKKLGNTYTDFFNKKTENQKVRSNAVVGLELLISYTNGSLLPDEVEKWIKQSVKWVFDTFGKNNIYDFQFHQTEHSDGHAHLILIPLDKSGKLNCRALLNGADVLRKMQTSYYEAVKDLGLQRGRDKRLTKAEHTTSLEWHKANAEKEARLKTYETLFGHPLDWELNKRLYFNDVYSKFIDDNSKDKEKKKVKFNVIDYR